LKDKENKLGINKKKERNEMEDKIWMNKWSYIYKQYKVMYKIFCHFAFKQSKYH
jgi:hypothetical protein